MYWRGLPAQEKLKYSLSVLLVTLIYFYTVLVLYKSRDERDCDLLITQPNAKHPVLIITVL